MCQSAGSVSAHALRLKYIQYQPDLSQRMNDNSSVHQSRRCPIQSQAIVEVTLLNFLHKGKEFLEAKDLMRFATAAMNLMPPGFYRNLFWNHNLTLESLPRHLQVNTTLGKMREFLQFEKEVRWCQDCGAEQTTVMDVWFMKNVQSMACCRCRLPLVRVKAGWRFIM